MRGHVRVNVVSGVRGWRFGQIAISVGCCGERLRALGYIATANPFHQRSETVVSLTEKGRSLAADRLGRSPRNSGRDDGCSVTRTLRVAELYVRLVTGGAKDWLAVRANADRFEWYAFDRAPDLSEGIVKLAPDAVLDTASQRYVIDVAPTAKSQAARIERYSRAATASERPHVLVVVTDTAMGEQRPAVFAGNLDQVIAFLRRGVGLQSDPTNDAKLSDELRSFMSHLIKRSGLSSINWPPNWRTVMSAVFGTEAWKILGPQLEQRAANAHAREQRGDIA